MTQSSYISKPPQPAVPQRDPNERGCIAQFILLVAEFALLVALAAYIMVGAESVPFHGDESTILYTTRDLSYFLQGQIKNILYSDTPDAIGPSAKADQELRLLNGSVARYVYGAAALNPKTAKPYDPINEQWDWSNGYAYNVETGHMPAPRALLQARLISSLVLVGAMLSLYSLARRIGGPGVAVIAVIYFTFNPAVLLNGRRAMQESFWLFFGLNGLNLALDLSERIQGMLRPQRYSRGHFLGRYRVVPLATYITLGGTLGFALASKHTALFYVVAALGAVILAPLFAKRRIWLKHVFGVPLMLAALVAAFIVISPAWWGDPVRQTPLLPRFDPIDRLETVLTLRADLMAGQTSAFGSYANTAERLNGLFQQGFVVRPQYYEVSNWQDFIGGQIAMYEALPWHGISVGGSELGGAVVMVMVLIGVMACVRSLVYQPSIPVDQRPETVPDSFSVPSDDSSSSTPMSTQYQQEMRTPDPVPAVPVSAVWPPRMGAWVALWLGLAGFGAALTTPLDWQRYYLPLYPAIAVFLGLGIIRIVRGLGAWRGQSVQPPRDPFSMT